jgi:hypothetical protein
MVLDAPSAEAEMTNHDELICARLPWSGEERAAGRLAGLRAWLWPSGQAPGR